jgi:RHS Repeat
MAKNDREKEGLLGPVHVCVETSERDQGNSQSVETTYDVAGNLLTTRGIPETWMRTRTYDELGRLTKISNVQSGELEDETFYSYDEAGRVSTIKTVGNGEHLRKGGTFAIGMSALLEDREEFMVPFSGTLHILYNHLGQATELHKFDAGGQLVSKAFRAYDLNGWIVEETEIVERADLRSLESIPAETRAEMKPEELELARRMLERFREMGKTRKSFSYDAKGRLVQATFQTAVVIMSRSLSYNEKGDKTEARTATERNNDFFTGPYGINKIRELTGSKDASGSAPASWPLPFEDRMHLEEYDYARYDEQGNWMERKATLQSGAHVSTAVTRRTLSYF